MTKKEEEFYPLRSDLIGSLITFIKNCQETGRDITDEINEVLFESQDELNIKDKITVI